MSGTVHYYLGKDIQWIYVQTFAQYGSPVYYHTAYGVVLEDDVLHRVAVEDRGTRMYRMVEQGGSALYGIHYIEAVFVLLVVDFKFLYDVDSLFLYDNLVEHHGAAPHAAAGSQLTVELRNFQSCLS